MLHTHRRWALALGLLAFALVSVSGICSRWYDRSHQRPSLRQRFERSNPGREDFRGLAVAKCARLMTDALGSYAFLSLAPDTYSVTAEKAGYDISAQRGITVLSDHVQLSPLRL